MNNVPRGASSLQDATILHSNLDSYNIVLPSSIRFLPLRKNELALLVPLLAIQLAWYYSQFPPNTESESMVNQTIRLLDLITKEKLDEILQAFTEVSGIASVITDTSGRPITATHNFTSFCTQFCRSTVMGRELCYRSDSLGGAKSLELKKPYVYKCLNAGLTDWAMPIIVDGYHLANFLCGQVKEEPIPREEAIQRAQAIGIKDLDGYLEALDRVPRMTRERLLSIANFMAVITQNVSELALHKFLFDKQSKQYLNKLINSVSDCIISTDADAKIFMVNDACVKTFGLEAEKLCGQSIFSLLSDENSKESLKKQMEVSRKGKGRLELTALKGDKKTFPAQVSFSRISGDPGEISDYVAVLRDVSEEKKVERLKEDLVGMLTHDMGNPIVSIQKALELLHSETIGSLNINQKEILGLSISTNRQLYRMVANFLDFYRSENGQFLLRKQVFDINRAINESINGLKFLFQEKNISVNFEQSHKCLEIDGDRSRIKRTITNLLGNSIKYSLDGGEIRVGCRVVNGRDPSLKTFFNSKIYRRLQPSQPYVLTTVHDNGFGIPKKYQQAIFEKFFTLDTRDGQGRRGLGLGLTFCKLVAEAHGGAICVKTPTKSETTQKTRGCLFSIILPCGV